MQVPWYIWEIVFCLVNWIFQLTEGIFWKSFLLLRSFFNILVHLAFLIYLWYEIKIILFLINLHLAMPCLNNTKWNHGGRGGFELCCSFDTAGWHMLGMTPVHHYLFPWKDYTFYHFQISFDYVLPLVKEIETEEMRVSLGGSL